jgi:hypothetical protein
MAPLQPDFALRGRRGRPRSRLAACRGRDAAVLALGCALTVQGCTDRHAVQVVVASITVIPASVTLVVGENVQIVARIVGESGRELSQASPTWSSSSPSVAEVDSTGVVRGMSEGTARIEAWFGGVSGAADVRVLPGPRIQLSQSAVEMFAGAGGTRPPSPPIHVTNGGTGTLTGLGVDVHYPADAHRWLEAEIAGVSAPTTLTLIANIEGMEVGVWPATLVITSSAADVATVELPVTLTLTGFSVEETDGSTIVSETGTQDELDVVLDSPPSRDVVITVKSDDTGEAVLDRSTLTFTPGNWDVRQRVVVTGVDDFADDDDQVTTLTFSVVAEASDEAFHGVPPKTIEVTTTDDDEPPGIVIVESGDTRVSEDGTTDSFSVALTTRPATDVLLTVTSGDPGEVVVNPSTLTFTTNNWDVARTVTVTGVDDFADDGDQVTTITVAVVAVASDDAFDGVAARVVNVTTTDNDERPGLIITQSGDTRVSEDGTTDTFTVALTTRPGTDVVLTVRSGDLGEVVVSPTTLTFTTNNWDVAQTVTVTGIDDLVVDGDQVTAITISVVAEASDNAFDGIPAQTVHVTTSDNDGG